MTFKGVFPTLPRCLVIPPQPSGITSVGHCSLGLDPVGRSQQRPTACGSPSPLMPGTGVGALPLDPPSPLPGWGADPRFPLARTWIPSHCDPRGSTPCTAAVSSWAGRILGSATPRFRVHPHLGGLGGQDPPARGSRRDMGQLGQWVPHVERSWRAAGGMGTPKPRRSQGTPAFHCCGMKAVLGAPL